MPKIKNWNNTSDGPNVYKWRNTKTGSLMQVEGRKGLGDYRVMVLDDNSRKKVRKSFDNKQDALEWSRSWMKDNPRK